MVGHSYVDATFESSLVRNSPANPFQYPTGNIEMRPGDRLFGIPHHRLRATLDRELTTARSIGLSPRVTSASFLHGDESNQNAPLSGYRVIDLQSGYRFYRHVEAFVTLQKVLNARYSTFGTYGDPTGVGAAGARVDGSGASVDNRFVSAAQPFAVYAGIRVSRGRLWSPKSLREPGAARSDGRVM